MARSANDDDPLKNGKWERRVTYQSHASAGRVEDAEVHALRLLRNNYSSTAQRGVKGSFETDAAAIFHVMNDLCARLGRPFFSTSQTCRTSLPVDG